MTRSPSFCRHRSYALPQKAGILSANGQIPCSRHPPGVFHRWLNGHNRQKLKVRSSENARRKRRNAPGRVMSVCGSKAAADDAFYSFFSCWFIDSRRLLEERKYPGRIAVEMTVVHS